MLVQDTHDLTAVTDAERAADELRNALSNVIDPELGIDIVALGLVYHASIDRGQARVVFTLTSPACPLGSLIERQIREAVAGVDGVDAVETQLVFDPPWEPQRMNDEAKLVLGFARGGRP